jgi:exopolyphosphatase
VLKWKSDFEQFQATHDALLFLQSPTTGSHQHKESHLFWQNAAALPSGSDSATSSLEMLGKLQLHQVLEYLWQAVPYVSVLEEGAHQHYHNLRKQLRSVVDEYELFGNVMYPETEQVASAMAVLTRARTRLGNINDDWTAYSIYVENGEYYSEQQRLEIKIDESWTKFRVWVHKVKFEDVIQYLVSSLNRVPQAVHKTLCLNQFLQDRKRRPTRHLVIGNEAGDADSIISAITLAYVESSQEEIESTPIVSIPKADLTTQRPEVSLLMEMAGIVNASSNLIFVDDPLIQHDAIDSKVTLVDHNILAEKFQGKNWTVVEIVDHHQDEGLYFETCSGNDRTIAFVNDKALVASACTLVAERLRKVWKPPYPVSIAVLLLGVILLDSVNLSPEVGKVTQRDKDAIDDLLVNTEWKDLPADARLTIGMGTGDPVPNSTILFNVLQGAKYDKDFWKSLSVRDALRYDYKEYSSCGQTFGVSTVLMPLRPFFGKDTVTTGILDYMKAMNVAFLGIMFASIDNKGHLFRQLAFCATNGFSMKDLGEFLHESDYYHGLLDLKEIQDSFLPRHNQGLSLQFFDQRNVQPSRKQIGPALEEFFQYISKSTCNTDQDLADS